MKKHTKTKSKSSSAVAAANQDIVGLLTMLVQKLTSFEAKLDTVLSRVPPVPFAAPKAQPMSVSQTQQRREHRPMHKAVCADCGKDCEVPFKPSGDRPVYCKECFTTRKSNGTFKPRRDRGPEEGPAHARPPEKPQAVEPAKAVRKKKTSAKKKKSRK